MYTSHRPATWVPVVLVVAAMVSGCESDPMIAATDDGTYLTARLESVSPGVRSVPLVEHRGGAQWSMGSRGSQERLGISSRDGAAQRTVYLDRLGPNVHGYLMENGFFQVGTHPLVPRSFNAGDNSGYTALYVDGESGDHYIAESGSWTIIRVDETAKVVTGHFDFVAVLWCNVRTSRQRCLLSPKDVSFDPDAARLRVHGEYRAGPPRPAQEF